MFLIGVEKGGGGGVDRGFRGEGRQPHAFPASRGLSRRGKNERRSFLSFLPRRERPLLAGNRMQRPNSVRNTNRILQKHTPPEIINLHKQSSFMTSQSETNAPYTV